MILYIAKKTIDKLMYEALVGLYQSFVVSRQMILRNKLSTLCMTNTNTIVRSLARVTE